MIESFDISLYNVAILKMYIPKEMPIGTEGSIIFGIAIIIFVIFSESSFSMVSNSAKRTASFIKNKFQDHKLPLVDEVIELDAKARKAKQEADALRA